MEGRLPILLVVIENSKVMQEKGNLERGGVDVQSGESVLRIVVDGVWVRRG